MNFIDRLSIMTRNEKFTSTFSQLAFFEKDSEHSTEYPAIQIVMQFTKSSSSHSKVKCIFPLSVRSCNHAL